MAFGQTSGPPASSQQVAELLELLGQRGFDSFREARHTYGLSQRQASGKFTRAEAADLIERINAAGDEAGDAPPEPEAAPMIPRVVQTRTGRVRQPAARPPRSAPPDAVAMAFPDELLAEELIRRGWTCIPPSGSAP